MAKNVNHVLHIKSSTVIESKPKLPNASSILEGEIAVNFADGYETLSIKNSNGKITPFSSDDYYTEKKLGSGFTDENSAKTVTDAYNEMSGAVSSHTTNATIHLTSTEKEQLHTHSNKTYIDGITGAIGTMAYENATSYSSATQVNTALGNKLDTTAYTPTDLTNYYTKSETSGKTEISNALSGKVDYESYENDSMAISISLNDLNSRKLDISAYTPTDLTNYYTKSETSGKTEISTALSNCLQGTLTRVAVSSNQTNVNPASSLASGSQLHIIYYNNGSADYTISVTTTYTTPDGQQIVLTCPQGGYCELNIMNIDGVKYARGI